MGIGNPLVCVIILNWNGLNDTIECIESVENCAYNNFKITIVDNCSSGDQAYELKKAFPSHDVLLCQQNYGYTGGNNAGIIYTRRKYNPDYVLVLNNDTVVDPSFINYMIETFSDKKEAGIVGSMVYYYGSNQMIQSAGGRVNMTGEPYHVGNMKTDEGQYNYEYEIDYVMGSAMMISKDVIDRIGLFDDSFFCYWDETDLCFRAREAGYSVVISPHSIIWHKNSTPVTYGDLTKRKQPPKNIVTYYYNRNRIMFVRKHGSKLQYLVFSVRFVVKSVIVLLFYVIYYNSMGSVLSYLKGTADGVRYDISATKVNDYEWIEL